MLVIDVVILAIVGTFACFVGDFLARLLAVIAVMALSLKIGVNLMDWENGEDDDNE